MSWHDESIKNGGHAHHNTWFGNVASNGYSFGIRDNRVGTDPPGPAGCADKNCIVGNACGDNDASDDIVGHQTNDTLISNNIGSTLLLGPEHDNCT
jgi:hypothetical protein